MLILFASYVCLKCCIFQPIVRESLQSVIELSTPVTSFVRLKEGLFLLNDLQISPYEGDVFRQSPLLLSLFSIVPKSLWSSVFLVADLAAAYSLALYARKNYQTSMSPKAVAAVYLFNPYCFAASLAQSTNVLTNALICGAIASAANKKVSFSLMQITLASVLGWYPSYYIPSICGIIMNQNEGYSIFRLSKLTAIGLLVFLALGYLTTSSWDFLDKQFGALLLLRDLTQPNLGLWWYFFIEMIDFFRPFFLGAFQLFLLSFPVPLIIRFPQQPLFTLTSMVGVLAIFKPYTEASDMGVFITLLVLQKDVFDLMEYRLFEVLGLLHVIVLAPVFYYLWIFMGSGNANFYYAITLVYTVTAILLLADSIWSRIRLDFDGGKAKNLTQQ